MRRALKAEGQDGRGAEGLMFRYALPFFAVNSGVVMIAKWARLHSIASKGIGHYINKFERRINTMRMTMIAPRPLRAIFLMALSIIVLLSTLGVCAAGGIDLHPSNQAC